MRPTPQDYPGFAEAYIQQVREEHPTETLKLSLYELEPQLSSIGDAAADLTYAPGKWTVSQVLRHVIDTERIFAYRALCLARGEQQVLPPFDEGDYAQAAEDARSDLAALKAEFMVVRQSTVYLFQTFPEPLMARAGVAGGSRVTVNALAYMILGHWRHHAHLLRIRYGLDIPGTDTEQNKDTL